MATKQLEILVTARDQASGVFRGVGDSADGLSGRLGSLNEIAEAGHGLHSILRQARNVAIAFEVIPVGVDAVKAAWATLTGSAEEAATGQRKLFDAIKEFPLIGKIVAPAAEWISSTIAHALGRESTADIEAEMAKKKAILEDFAAASKKLKEDLAKEDDKVAMAGLFPSDQQIAKAQAEYAHQMQEVHNAKRAIILAAGEGKDVREAMAEVERVQEDAEKVRLNEIREAHAKEIEEDEAFSSKLVQLQKAREDSLDELQKQQDRKSLEQQGRGFEAKIAGINDAADKQIAALRAGLQKQKEETQKQIEQLQPIAQSGSPDAAKAQQKIDSLSIHQETAGTEEAMQENLIRQGAAKDAQAERDAELKRTQLDLLRQQAAEGDKAAAAQVRQQEIADDLKQKRAAILSILQDGTDEEKAGAREALKSLDAQQAKLKALQSAKDQAADAKADAKLDREIDRDALKDQKAEAKQAKKDEAVGPADLEASQFLTGVTAKAQQQKAEYDPIIQAQDKTTGAVQNLIEVFKEWMGMGQNQIRDVKALT
jgi:hypothetical protein